ncbi:unnamed protein product [Rotaria sordida]|uniref:MULE transposase domain-containing protein n=1 Tax=Rotaria sordida TaxID=392033 RepID=A0A820CE79_9BILA|nr:unnamed protein product [Rotaria sordida]
MEAAHEHHNDRICCIDEYVKKSIENLFDDAIKKSKLILRALQSKGINMPTLAQLNNYLILYNDEEYKDDEDVEDNGGNKFRIFISSIHLLNIVSMSQHIHVDATYQVIWQGFPVLVIGTTDLNKAFHPFGLAICSNEKKTKYFEFIFKSVQIGMQKINKALLQPTALILDAVDSIKNDFKNVFNDSYNQLMYWAHMKRKVENCICKVDDKHIRKELMDDIALLQLCNSTIACELVSILFYKKMKYEYKAKKTNNIRFFELF